MPVCNLIFESRRERAVKSSNDAFQGFGAPVLAVCGFSGAGKTTLLESAIPRLIERGLTVAVVKHDAHGFEVDRPGKDSDRLFRAGATITLSGQQEQFERRGAAASAVAWGHAVAVGMRSRPAASGRAQGHTFTKVWLAKAERPRSAGERFQHRFHAGVE